MKHSESEVDNTMLKAVFCKVAWLGRATAFTVGLAVILALTVGVTSAALAGTGPGSVFNLGRINNAYNTISTLMGNANGPELRIINDSTATAATALDLRVQPGHVPMRVNSTKTIPKLSADLLDGKNSSAFMSANTRTYDTGINKGPGSTTVTCHPGDILLSGGYRGGNQNRVVTENGPTMGDGTIEPTPPQSWTVTWIQVDPYQSDALFIYARCADVG